MNYNRTRTLRKLLRQNPRRISFEADGATRPRPVWAVAFETEDPEMMEVHTGDTRNEALRAAYEAGGATK